MRILTPLLLLACTLTVAAFDPNVITGLAGEYVWQDPGASDHTKMIVLEATGQFTLTEKKDEDTSNVITGEWKWAASPRLSGNTYHVFRLLRGDKVIDTLAFPDQFTHAGSKGVFLQKEERSAERQLLVKYLRVDHNESADASVATLPPGPAEDQL